MIESPTHKNMIINIQFLRAWAALAVVFFHLGAAQKNLPGLTGSFFEFLFQFGYAGVDVFFVISGYVIWISSSSQKDITENKQPVHFIFNRAARIYLGYWPYFIIALIIYLLLAPERLTNVDLLGSATLTKFHLPQLLIQVTWTLIYELYFYLFFAFLLIFPRKYMSKLLLFAGLFIVLIQLYSISQNDIYAPENLNHTSLFFTFFVSPFCLQFLAGCALGLFFENHRLKYLKLTAVLAVAVFAFILWYQKTYLLPTNLLSQGYYMPERAILYGVFATLLVAFSIESERRGRQWWPGFSKLIGGASYSLYLAHMPLLFVVSQLGVFVMAQQQSWLWLAPWVIIFVILLYSVAHYWWVEKPLLKQAKKLEESLFK